MKTILYIFAISVGLFFTSYNTLNKMPNKVKKIVIDAGHGGKDPGCIGKNSKEKDLTLAIALEFGALVNTYLKDVEVIYTRKTNEFVALNERARIANKEQADLFISIHCNATEFAETEGTETYVMGLNSQNENLSVAIRENSAILQENNYKTQYDGIDPNSAVSYIIMANYQQTFQTKSLKMANQIETQFKHKLQRNSRGVKQSSFIVLWKTSMPSVLVETGFLSNPKEEQFLKTDLGKTQIAASLYRALRDYKSSIEEK